MKSNKKNIHFNLLKYFVAVFFSVNVLFCFTIKAETYYVDQNHPESRDSNPGSEKLPWVSMQKGVSTIQAGDTLFIKNGKYQGEFNFHGLKGTTERPTVIQAYPRHRVTFRGQDIHTGRTKIINCKYLEIKGIEVTEYNQGIFIQEGSSYITIDSISVHFIGQEGIHVKENSSHILFKNCRVFDTGKWQYNGEGFYIGTGSAGPLDNTSHVTVRNCIIYNTTDEAIEFKPGTHHCIAEGNVVYNAKSDRTWGAIEVNQSKAGVQVWNADPEHTVRNNIVYSTNGTAIRAGTGCKVYNNVIYNVVSPYYGIYINNSNEDSYTRQIYHNTVHIPSSRAIVIQSGTTDIRNNIGTAIAGNIATNENFYVSTESGSEDFHLVSGSAPIDAGKDVGIDVDFTDNKRPHGSGYDMGAYEFTELTTIHE